MISSKAFMINPYEPGDVGEFYQKLSEFILEAYLYNND